MRETLPLQLSKSPNVAGVYDLFWGFAAERQRIFLKRLADEPEPWTNDQILQEYRFTNVYRATDRVSQYLIRNVIYDGDQSGEEVLFRILLFKLFNKIETWEILLTKIGQPVYKKYKRDQYLSVLNQALAAKQPIYSAAYIMAPPSGPFNGLKKHEAHLRLVERMLSDKLPSRLEKAKSLRGCYELLADYPMIGEFLGFQLAIDLNYSQLINFSEMDFVIAGPGAKSGITKCFGPLRGKSFESVITEVAERQRQEFKDRGIDFPGLWGRSLQLIDVQNLFCEIDKYTRVAKPDAVGLGGRSRIKRKFQSAGKIGPCFLPPKWQINIPMSQQMNKAIAPDSVPIYFKDSSRGVNLNVLQLEQFRHDQACHVDILSLPLQDKLKHFVLHFSKYVGKLAHSLRERPASGEAQHALVDAFIITLAAANALGMALADRVENVLSNYTAKKRTTSLDDSVLVEMAIITGKMAKACEALDHLERVDFRGELERGVIEMAGMLLANVSSKLEVATRQRWAEVEARAIKRKP